MVPSPPGRKTRRGSILGAFPRRRVHERPPPPPFLTSREIRSAPCPCTLGREARWTVAAFAAVPASRARRERLRRAYPRPSHPTSPLPSSPVLAEVHVGEPQRARPPPRSAPAKTRGAATRARRGRSRRAPRPRPIECRWPMTPRSSRCTAAVPIAEVRGTAHRGGARGTKSIPRGSPRRPSTCTTAAPARHPISQHRRRGKSRSKLRMNVVGEEIGRARGSSTGPAEGALRHGGGRRVARRIPHPRGSPPPLRNVSANVDKHAHAGGVHLGGRGRRPRARALVLVREHRRDRPREQTLDGSLNVRTISKDARCMATLHPAATAALGHRSCLHRRRRSSCTR